MRAVTISIARPPAVRVHVRRRIGAALLGAIAVLALVGQFRMPLTGDVAFHLDGARRLLNGATLYEDVAAPETPFVFWAAAPAPALGNGPGAGTIFRAMTLLLTLAAVGLVSRLTHELPGWIVGVVIAAVVLPVWYFATPEYLAFVLLVPYVALAAARATARDTPPPLATGCGVLAAFGCALEPSLLTAAAALIALRVRQTRSGRELALPEHVAFGSGVVVAAVLVFVLAPGYSEIVRDTGRARALTPSEFHALFTRDVHVWTAGLALAAFAMFGRDPVGRPAIAALAAATGGALVSAVLQQTGEGPDFFPALGFAVMLLTTLFFAEPVGSPRMAAARRVAAVLLLVPAGYLFGAVTWRRANAVFTRTRADQLVVMRMLGPQPAAVAVVSADIADAYPVVLERGHHFVPRYPSFWAARLAEADPVRTRVIREYGQDLRQSPPTALVVRVPEAGHARPRELIVDYLALLCSDALAREVLSDYRLAERAGGFELYRPGAEGAAACASS